MSDQNRFSDRLIAAERINPKRKEQYEMEMQRILNPTLKPVRRVIIAVIAIIALLAAIDFGTMTVTASMSGDFAGLGRALFALFAVILLAVAVVAGRMAIKGRASIRQDVSILAKLRWGLSIMCAVVAFVLTWADVKYGTGKSSSLYAAAGVAFLIFSAIHIIWDKIQQSEVNTREQVLTLELRLAELNEKLDKKQS